MSRLRKSGVGTMETADSFPEDVGYGSHSVFTNRTLASQFRIHSSAKTTRVLSRDLCIGLPLPNAQVSASSRPDPHLVDTLTPYLRRASLRQKERGLILLSSIKRYPLATFFALAYCLSWLLWIPTVLGRQDHSIWAGTCFILGGFGPLLAGAAVTTAEEGKSGLLAYLGRIVSLRARPVWYAVTLSLPLLLALLGYALHRTLGASAADLGTTPSPLMYPLILLGAALVGGGLEEPGWRGYALPRLLQHHNPLAASLILGVLWGLWHLPLFVAATTAQSDQPFFWYLLNAVGLSIIFTWLYRKADGSILLAVLFHAGVNAAWAWLPSQAAAGVIHPLVPYTAVTWAAAVTLMIFTEGSTFLSSRR